MSNAKHTPGPWEVFTNEERGQFRIADSETAQKTIGWAYKAGDARLIAAAPKLLEALEQISHAEAATYDDIHAAIQDLVGIARAAIAKATGSAS